MRVVGLIVLLLLASTSARAQGCSLSNLTSCPSPPFNVVTANVVTIPAPQSGTVASGACFNSVGNVIACVPGTGPGNVTGPSSATSGHIATFNGTTGKLVQDGGVAVGTSGAALPLLNGNNTESGNNTHAGSETFSAAVVMPAPGALTSPSATHCAIWNNGGVPQFSLPCP